MNLDEIVAKGLARVRLPSWSAWKWLELTYQEGRLQPFALLVDPEENFKEGVWRPEQVMAHVFLEEGGEGWQESEGARKAEHVKAGYQYPGEG